MQRKIGRLRKCERGIISLIIGPIVVFVIFILGLVYQYFNFSTPTEIRGLRGEGEAEVYSRPYAEVFEEAALLMNELGLSIVESNPERAYMVVTPDNSGFIYEGRIMALFFSAAPAGGTRLEIVAKYVNLPPLRDFISPKMRPSEIFNKLGSRLDGTRYRD
ncbi:MAG: hypothetical protein ACT4NX_04815 [Deltaproteobacteria bacterium]